MHLHLFKCYFPFISATLQVLQSAWLVSPDLVYQVFRLGRVCYFCIDLLISALHLNLTKKRIRADWLTDIYKDRKPPVWGDRTQPGWWKLAQSKRRGLFLKAPLWCGAEVCLEFSGLAKCGNTLEELSSQQRHLNDPGEGSEGVLPTQIGGECFPHGCGDKSSLASLSTPNGVT